MATKIKSREDIKRDLVKYCKENLPEGENITWISENNYEMISPKCTIKRNGYVFRLRYSPLFDTPFEEDQPKDVDVKLSRINMDECELTTPAADICLYRFLMLNPSNKANGGKRFRLQNLEKEAEVAYDFYEILDKAAIKIRESELEEAKAAYSVISGLFTMDMSGSEVRLALRKIADKEPQKVLDAYENETTIIKYRYLSALRLGYLSLNETETALKWSGSDRPFLTIVAGESMSDRFSAYCLSERGREVYQTLCDKLKN